MTKRTITLGLICLAFQLGLPNVTRCEMNLDREKHLNEEIKAQVFKIGTGESADVEIVLQDKQKLKGHIIEVGESNFKIMNKTETTVTTVAYSQVQKVKPHRWAGKTKIILGIALIVGIVVAVAVSLPK